MDFYAETDQTIERIIGERFRSLRLRKNTTQQMLADEIDVSVNTIKSLEKGQSKLTTMISVLRVLGELDSLDVFIPEINISPLQLAKQKGQQRQRATGSRGKSEDESEW